MSASVDIHSTAIVDPKAKLGVGVKVGPYAVVGPDVALGDGVEVQHHASVINRTTVGEKTTIFPFATVGSPPQDLKYKGEPSLLEIGTHNSIREYVNINVGTESGGNITKIGNHNLLMVYTHIAHDCILKDRIIIANSVQVAGHVEIDDKAVIGGATGIHQFVKLGTLAMVGGGSMLAQDVPPLFLVQGDRARTVGLNLVGIKRDPAFLSQLPEIKKVFSMLMQEGLTPDQTKEKLLQIESRSPVQDIYIDFLERSNRGLCRLINKKNES